MNIVRRSMPMPIPEQVGMPYSSARTKSMSMNMASSSPFSGEPQLLLETLQLVDRVVQLR